MDYKSYYAAREVLRDILEKDFLGPVAADEIICDERPLDYYILGKLYPQKEAALGNGDIKTDEEELRAPSEDVVQIDYEAQDSISLCNGKNPSSCGLSFCLIGGVKSFSINVKAAGYRLIPREEAREILGFSDYDYREKAQFWKRELTANDFRVKVFVRDLSVGKIHKIKVCEGLALWVLPHKIYSDGSMTITISLVNEQESADYSNNAGESFNEDCVKAFFQPEIQIIPDTIPSFGDIRHNIELNKDAEVKELTMLYSHVGNFASGHGCASDWKMDEHGNVVLLKTEFLPLFELEQMKPSASFSGEVLSMKYLSEEASDKIIMQLTKLTDLYSQWIEDRKREVNQASYEHKESAKINITKCEETRDRLLKAINELKDPKVFNAFSLANKAMFMQRKKMLENTGKYKTDEEIKWYPFQLAFFLQEIYSFAHPDSKERKNVDLLWFNTGGGKTEAYLGIAAFAIFLRRFRYGDKGDGVTVLMRYTLRLLSFQQFERASALICACELIRKDKKIAGGEIGIGLWAGQALTPNYVDDAKKYFEKSTQDNNKTGNPAQIKKCPWCGAEIPDKEPYYTCDSDNHRMYIKCSNPKCDFNTGLPIYLIDEEIYHYTPTYIIATLDKFAQLALNEDTSALFGIGKKKMPPDLIIQDELHLISGPLGTITGLYEAAISKLCEFEGRKPKIIASTATIRNAKEQIKALYASDYTQFPPQGININDSFFAEISKKTERPARLYIGCMAIGTSPTTMMIRVMASLLFASRYLEELNYEEKVIDSFWTITGYFNTLRELGGAIVRVVDDIQDRFSYLKTVKFAKKFPITAGRNRYDRYKELTSREKSENIGRIITGELQIPYKNDMEADLPLDFLLASNMLSVGIDIARLNTMVVVGQPKTTAEYIQATSRVGRETPGFVVTTYNQAKSRDRSHYEQFRQYHESFYKHVEATSVTPFSDRARDRALQALFVILCRFLINDLKHNKDAKNFYPDMLGVKEVKDYILNYISLVDPSEVNAALNEINEIENEWYQRAYRATTLLYRDYRRSADTLFDPDYMEESRFRILNTMRSVETMVNVISKE